MTPLARQSRAGGNRAPVWALALLAVTLGLAGCGGGGGGGGGGGTAASEPAQTFAASATLANACTAAGEKAFIRAYLDEVYLWYNEIPVLNAASYSTAADYFYALRVRTPDSNGQPKDQFSFSVSSADADAFSSGLGFGYGIAWGTDTIGRQRVAQVTPASPAASAGMARGGVYLGLISGTANWYNNAPGASVTFLYQDTPASVTREVTLRAASVQDDPVPLATTVTTPLGRQVGYLLFNDHSEGAQDRLIGAIQSLKDRAVTQLVLDMRYNTGGYLYVAGALASMLAGPAADGQAFEALRFNDKRQAESAQSVFRFSGTVQYPESFAYWEGYPLPRLNLPTVHVLTSPDTCSASESVINGLRGVDIQVVLIGQQTCGKPFGFTRKDNCGRAYYPIEFQGTNAKGFGDYSTGFAPTCSAADDLDHPLGLAQEGHLAAALHHIDTGVCAPAAARAPRQLATTRAEGSRAGAPARPIHGRLLRAGPN